MTRACSATAVVVAARALALALALPLALTSCSQCATGDDAARAVAERAMVNAKLESSLTLLPYRAVKTLTRSKGAPNRPAAWSKLDSAIDATAALPSRELTGAEATAVGAAYGALALALVQAQGDLKGHDEDEFPLLWQTVVKQPLPAAWYDNGAEHLGLATAWLLLDVADGATAKKLPAHDVIFYESTRSTVDEAKWPREARAWSQLLRGAAYCQGEHHYAAEEELTTYLASINAQPIDHDVVLPKLTLPAADAQRGFRALGHFARAWNRMGLGRDDPAAEDLEAGLKDLDGLGIDNELTQWGWAFVHYQRQNFPESAKQLEKLAQSPNLDEKTRADIKASAASLNGTTKAPVLGRVQGGAILGSALLARAGGVGHILEVVLGSEPAQEAKKPIEWLHASRTQLATNAKDLAASKLDQLKQLKTD